MDKSLISVTIIFIFCGVSVIYAAHLEPPLNGLTLPIFLVTLFSAETVSYMWRNPLKGHNRKRGKGNR